MPLVRPTLRQIVSSVNARIISQLPDANPTIVGSFFRAMVVSIAARINAANILTEQASREAFPDTASGSNLERFSSVISRNSASGATGQIVLFGTALSTVPIQTALTSSSGSVYRTIASVVLASQSISISSLSASGGVATAVAPGHLLATGQSATIAGANDEEYNGSFIITVLDDSTFTYAIAGSPNSPTSGTMFAQFTGAVATVSSEGVGISTNLDGGERLQITSPIAGVDGTALVRNDGVTGGADLENDDSLRARIIEFRSAIRANFSVNAIEVEAKKVSGVTRVVVQRATPAAGDATVLFVRDGDDNIIPSSSDVQNVRDRLLALLPATTEESALIVSAPTANPQDFTFIALEPNTEAMRDAVAATLQAFYEDQVEIGVSIDADTYRAAISQTSTGDAFLQSFTLSAPAGDIVILGSEIGTLGEVTFP